MLWSSKLIRTTASHRGYSIKKILTSARLVVWMMLFINVVAVVISDERKKIQARDT